MGPFLSTLLSVLVIYCFFCYIVFFGVHLERKFRFSLQFLLAPFWVPLLMGTVIGHLDKCIEEQEEERKQKQRRREARTAQS